LYLFGKKLGICVGGNEHNSKGWYEGTVNDPVTIVTILLIFCYK
jgi:hypothetical protein